MLDTWEQCPLKWYHKYILKEKEPSSPQLEHGNFVHKALEDYLMGRAPLPQELDRNASMVNAIKGQFKDQSRAELKLGVTKSLGPTEFFGKDVWGRAAADTAIIHYNSDCAFLGDWKTGKKMDKKEQLEIQAMMLFKHYGKLQKITGANIWLKDNTIGETYEFYRTNETDMWVSLLKRLQPMYDAIGTIKATETRPGFVCNFCPVKSCKWNKG